MVTLFVRSGPRLIAHQLETEVALYLAAQLRAEGLAYAAVRHGRLLTPLPPRG